MAPSCLPMPPRNGWFAADNRARLIGVPMEDLIMPEDHKLLVALQGLQFRPATTMKPLEIRFRAGDGKPLAADTTWLALQFEGEHSLLCVARDQTERKAIQARLAQADRLTTAGVLAAGVAHEINNPLTYIFLNLEAVRGSLQAAQHGADLDGAEAEIAVERAMVGAIRVRDIVKDLRSCTTDSDSCESVSINDVINKTARDRGAADSLQSHRRASVRPCTPAIRKLRPAFSSLSQSIHQRRACHSRRCAGEALPARVHRSHAR